MNLPPNDPNTRKFVTTVGLVTTRGPLGDNVMACEWTHHISYSPSLIAVCIRAGKLTAENIEQSKEFGVNLASVNQNWVASLAGNTSGHVVDKIAALRELGVEFYQAKTINVLMIKDAAMNVECKFIQKVDIGDHPILIGEVHEIFSSDAEPILYHEGKYWKLGEHIEKPPQEFRDKIAALIEKHRR